MALLRAFKKLESFQLEEAEEQLAVNILRRALQEPIRQIAHNAGEDGSVVAANVIKDGEGGQGYNAANGKYEDLIQAGVVDPTKVVRVALENAISASSMLLTTEVVITDLPEKHPPAPGPQMPGGGMGMPEF